jgi:hypothetical protein
VGAGEELSHPQLLDAFFSVVEKVGNVAVGAAVSVLVVSNIEFRDTRLWDRVQNLGTAVYSH